MPPPPTFGRYLRERREAAGLTLRELAERVGVSYSYLGQVERGVRPPLTPERWPALVAAIPGVTLDALERESAEDRPVSFDLGDAPREQAELALLLARRLRAQDLGAAQVSALLEILGDGSGLGVRAHGRVVDPSGRPIEGTAYVYRLASGPGWRAIVGAREHAAKTAGPLLGRVAHDTGKVVQLLPASDPRGHGFFDVVAGLPRGEYALHVHRNGRQEWAWPLVVTDGVESQDVRIGGPEPARPPAPPPVPEPVPGLDRHFTAGTFTASFSYYGFGGAPLDRIERDLERFRRAGFSSFRGWTEWEKPSAAARLFNRDGTPITAQLDKLEAVLDFSASIGVTADLTMGAGRYDAIKKGGGTGEATYDIAAHKKALGFLVSHFKGHPAIAFVDAGNECNQRGADGSGAPSTGHISPGRAKELHDVARNADPARRVTFSVEGDPKSCADAYAKITKRGVTLPLYAPHFPRGAGWGAKEGPNAKQFSSALRAGLPVHHQEPARRHYPKLGESLWSVAEFEAAFRSTRAAGSTGCCFHWQGCFDLATTDGWDQLDPVEREVVAQLAEWLR